MVTVRSPLVIGAVAKDVGFGGGKQRATTNSTISSARPIHTHFMKPRLAVFWPRKSSSLGAFMMSIRSFPARPAASRRRARDRAAPAPVPGQIGGRQGVAGGEQRL